jgi:hypothetical protein
MEAHMRKRKQLTLVSGLLIATSVALVIALLIRFLYGRQSKIQDTQKQIVDLLGQLDPIARMQVAQHVVETELNKLPVKSLSNA